MELHIKDFKKHYTGEWDFNQFNEIDLYDEGTEIYIPYIGNEELVFLQALDLYVFNLKVNFNDKPIYRPTITTSYISYLRDDKDFFSYSKSLISKVPFKFHTYVPPHENLPNIEYTNILFNSLVAYANSKSNNFTYILGADSSVKRFFDYLDGECTKVRENGKIVKFDIPKEVEKLGKDSNLIIVDDILGGGGTIKKIIEKVNPEVNITVIVGFTEDLEDFSDYPNVSLVAMTSLEKLKKSNKGE